MKGPVLPSTGIPKSNQYARLGIGTRDEQKYISRYIISESFVHFLWYTNTLYKWTRLLEHSAFKYINVRTYNGEMNKVSDGRARRHLTFIPALVSEIQFIFSLIFPAIHNLYHSSFWERTGTVANQEFFARESKI